MDGKNELTPKQELFCKLFATNREFFGNGTQAYIEAYGIDATKNGAYQAAKANASRMLTNDNLLARIREFLDEAGLNDANVDKQLYFLITQNVDFPTKMAAIREYNKLRNRIVEKVSVSTSLAEQLAAARKRLENARVAEKLEATEKKVENTNTHSIPNTLQ